MEFRILGPLEVRTANGAVQLGGVKPQAVAAVLLLRANEPVTAEQLAMALWGEDAPATATKTVQVHVSRLRKAFGDASVIETTRAGYRVRVRPGELDAERFQRLVGDGRRRLDAGEPEQAARILREALNLWRGAPLAGLEFEPFAPAEIARLADDRMTALELRFEAELAAGRHREIVGELKRLVAAHPTREPLVAHLMLALYRCGRQGDALEAYREARRALIDEAGIEPGPDLRDLQAAILRQNVPPVLPSPGAALPAALDESHAPRMVGRDRELARLRGRWEAIGTQGGACVAVVGEPGIGKTRLAAALAAEVHDGGATVLYANGRDRAAAIDDILRGAEAATRPTLLVLDDADCAERHQLEERVSELASQPVLTLATGQQAAGVVPDETMLLEPIGADAAHAIAAHYGAPTDGDPAFTARLLEEAEGVPGRLAKMAAEMARTAAARRVDAAAERAASGRADLRSFESELASGVIALQAASERIGPAAGAERLGVCPFKGLAAFDVADAPYFFGRERLVAELVARLVGAPALAVVGSSGSGKSSVIRAGLLPALASGVLPGSETWRQVLIRPGRHPVQVLRRALEDMGDDQPRVLAVDQFEETFTVCDDEAERAEFIAELMSSGSDDRGQGYLVLAIRADYYGRCSAYPQFSAALAANHVLVGSMRRRELRRAIEHPAQRAGLHVAPELTDALVADVEGEPGALPLLSTALLELWQRSDGGGLQLSSYEATGGVRGAVARLAEAAYHGLDADRREIARRTLMRLVGEGAEGVPERRRVPLAELESDSRDEVARVVGYLADHRLLTISAGSVELAHEALLREWPRLQRWLDEDAQGRRLHRRLSTAAREWDEGGRDPADLYRGARLASALEWKADHEPELNRVEHDFLAAADARAGHERSERRRWIRLAIGGLSVALAAITIVAALAIVRGNEAETERESAISRELAAKSMSLLSADPGLSVGLALWALERRDTESAENALRQAAYEARGTGVRSAGDGWLYAVATSRDGRWAATAGGDGAVRVWDLSRGRPAAAIRGHSGSVWDVAFSPDGGRVASAGSDGTVAIAGRDGGDRRVLAKLAPDYASSVEFSRNGDELLLAATDGSVRLLSVRTGAERTLRGHDGMIYAAHFDPDGRRIVSAGADGTARVWDVASGTATVLTHPDQVAAAVFSPDGRHVATAGYDGMIRVFSPDGSGRPLAFRGDRQAQYSVRYSADSRRLVTAGEDGVVRLWDAASGAALGELAGHRGRALQAGFLAGGDRVISAGEDGTLRTWAPAPTAVVQARVTGAGFDAAGRRVVGGGEDGSVRVWDLRTGAVRTLRGHTDLSFARFSPDGKRIISASADGSVRLWAPGGGRSTVVHAGDSPMYAAALDPAGQRVAYGGEAGEIAVRPLAGGRSVPLRGHAEPVYDLAFNADGSRIVSASEDGTARIWDTASGRMLRVLRGHNEAVNAAGFSPDGGRVVTGGSDGTVRVWRVRDGHAVILRGHESPLTTAAFGPRGDRVLSAGQDGTVRVWNAAGGETLLVLTTHLGRASGAGFSPDGARVVSAGDDGLIRVSPCETCGSLSDVVELARTRADRELSVIDRERFQPRDE